MQAEPVKKSLLHRGWQDGSEDKGACSQVGWSEFDIWDHVVEGENQLPQAVLWPSHMDNGMHAWRTQTCIHDRKINKWFFGFCFCFFKKEPSL